MNYVNNYIIKKWTIGQECNKILEDDSNILQEKRENKVLRDVNELMNYKKNSNNIYDYTSVGNNNYTKNMWFW